MLQALKNGALMIQHFQATMEHRRTVSVAAADMDGTA
jgi:hypothetical protein